MTRPDPEEVSEAVAAEEVRDVLREPCFEPDLGVAVSDCGGDGAAEASSAVIDALDGGGCAEETHDAPEPGPCGSKGRPEHYKVICISVYTDDLARLDEMVRELKRRGYTKANRSAVLRVALGQLDLDRVPPGCGGRR